jgi:hypothetical protein
MRRDELAAQIRALVDAVPPVDADAVVRRGARGDRDDPRRPRRRRVLLGVAAAAVLVGGMALVVSRTRNGPDVTTDPAAPGATDCTQVAVNRNPPDFGPGGAEVLVVPGEGGAPRLVTGDWVATEPSLSPDGREVVVVRAHGDYESAGPGSTSLWVVGTDGSGERQLTEGRWDDRPAWSPDGSQVAYTDLTGGDAVVRVVDAAGGEPRTVIDVAGTPYSSPAWSPDGERLAVISHRPGEHGTGEAVWTVAADGSDLREVATVGGARSLDWHPDGTSLLVSTFDGEDGDVYAVDVATGKAREVARHATLAAWSADGEDVYYLADNGDEPGAQWRLAAGHIEDGTLVRDRFVGEIADYLYPYFGLDAGPCPLGGNEPGV